MTKAQQKRVANYLRDHKANAELKAPDNNYREQFIWGYMESVIRDVLEALDGHPTSILLYKKGEN